MEAKDNAPAQKKRRVPATTFSPGVKTISCDVGCSPPPLLLPLLVSADDCDCADDDFVSLLLLLLEDVDRSAKRRIAAAG